MNRVKRAATSEIIKWYITSKHNSGSDNVGVIELPTEVNRFKAFVVTAPLNRKGELHQHSFWPQGVGIRRFEFARLKDFLRTAGDFRIS